MLNLPSLIVSHTPQRHMHVLIRENTEVIFQTALLFLDSLYLTGTQLVGDRKWQEKSTKFTWNIIEDT